MWAIAIAALAQSFHPEVPRAWDDREAGTFEMPLVQPEHSPRYLSAAEYYALDVIPIYRGYPVYVREKEPPGYMATLEQKDPELIFDPAKLRTKQDWIRAGSDVFRAPREFHPASGAVNFEVLRTSGVLPNRDGVVPFFQYVVRKKGLIEIGVAACANCHTRVLRDGTVVDGAQGNFPWARRDSLARANRQTPDPNRRALAEETIFYAAPWVARPDELYAATAAEQIRRFAAMQPGVIAREGTSSAFPVHVPSLIGVKDIHYLDATGLSRHRSIADLMRYAIVNQGFMGGLQVTAHFGDFQPIMLRQGRYSDEQLYALALYLYSLKPPRNENPQPSGASWASHLSTARVRQLSPPATLHQ